MTKETISEAYVPLEEAFAATFEGLADKNDKKFGKLRFAASPLFFAVMSGCLSVDPWRAAMGSVLLTGFSDPALLRYRQKHGRYPRRDSDEDAKELLGTRDSYLAVACVPQSFVPDDLVRWVP